ncbi:MAG: N-formylglutamate amidohydrolase [Cyclobacteriaceae bacterium]
MFPSVILSCEHAGNEVPEYLFYLFRSEPSILETHRGWDIGAWKLAQFLSARLNAPLLGCHTTRLLIEANRSSNSNELFSTFSSPLTETEKEKLVRDFYLPYRNQIQNLVEEATKPVLHLSIHSFTPIWNGAERTVDIGILFDPDRPSESKYSHHLKEALEKTLPHLITKYNAPYKGTDDGITTWLRKLYPDAVYTGIEIEVNQKFASSLNIIQSEIAQSIQSTLL